MSADNWGTCPKCKADEEARKQRAKEKLDESYGKIPAAEYLRKAEQLGVVPEYNPTLREDYQIYIDDAGVFSVEYRARCEVCGFEFVHDFEKNTLK
jgi:hypothetical protein